MYARAYARQHHKGKIFLHEAPIRSITWKNRDISWIASFPGVFKVKGPICRWTVCKADLNPVGFVRHAICWMTNDAQLARALADQCDGGSGEWTREASSAGGLDQIGAIVPPNLVTSVLKVIKRKILDLEIRVQFSCFPESILLVAMIRHFLEECIHDKLSERIVLQCLLS